MDPQQTNNFQSIVVAPNPYGENYYPEAAALRGLVSSEINELSLREALIQREMEKDRIREELMYEIMRKRELEAEVRRELAMEEFALRRGDGFPLTRPSSLPNGVGFGISERFAYGITRLPEPRASLADRSSVAGLANQDKLEAESDVPLPFQRNPEAAKILEINKAQLKDMAKPYSALVGKKRKLESNVVNDSTETSSKKNPWDCTLCNVSTTCENNLKVHLQGRKHKSKVKSEEAANSSIGKREAKKAKKKRAPLSEDEKNLWIEDLKEKFPFCCVVCMIGCHTEDVFMRHCLGRKHIARMEAPKFADDTASSAVDHVAEVNAEGPAEAEVPTEECTNEDTGELMFDYSLAEAELTIEECTSVAMERGGEVGDAEVEDA